MNRTLSFVPNATFVYLQPLNQGHLSIRGTLIWSNSVQIKEVPHNLLGKTIY